MSETHSSPSTEPQKNLKRKRTRTLHESPQKSDGEENDTEIAFSCKMDNVKELVNILQCLSVAGKKDQICQCDINTEGFTLIVIGNSKFTQAQAVIHRDLFQAFECDDQGVSYGINLNTLLECLQINGTANLGTTALSMSFMPDTAIFKMTLEDQEGIFTSCEINTVFDDGHMEFEAIAQEFRQSREVCSVILKSENLKEVVSEMNDVPGATDAVFFINSELLRLSTSGPLNASDFEIPRKSQLFVHYECKEEEVEWSYSIRALTDAMRALNYAAETYLRLNEEGLMCIQHQITALNQDIYVDFLICANEIDEVVTQP
mmetsp:Transcript_28774/g.37312  ORF Transcript_28774/g.37312 Transcript_28774/m.37312 type:complete len:318 (-) Transcript_28774:134-1087(-)